MNELLNPVAPQILLSHDQQENFEINSLKEVNEWLMVVKDINGGSSVYDSKELTTILRENILDGKHNKNSEVTIHFKLNDGTWSQANSTLSETAKSYFKLRVLYRPVWSYAMAGLKYGVITGIILKLLDTFIMLFSVNPGAAFLFAISIGVCFIPRIGWLGVAAIGFFMARFGGGNFFLMALGAGIAGAILGCLPGMGIGGIIGYFRKNSMQLAKDAQPESISLFIMTGLLPLIAGCVLIVFYILVITPWMVSLIE